jgi:hypothetical protein
VRTSAVHEYHVALLDAELADGRTVAAARDIRAIRRNQAAERANGVNTEAELAIFEAEHGSPERAVALGRNAVRVASASPPRTPTAGRSRAPAARTPR